MLKIKDLSEVRGNNVIIYSIKTLLEKRSFPHFSILAGHMGVGKSTVAQLVAEQLDETGTTPTTINFGLEVNMREVEENVFKMNPIKPKAFIFEELHGMDRGQQTALLTMLDHCPDNVYVICTTTEIYKILATIRSRATVWNFKLLGTKQLAQLLDDYLESINAAMTERAKGALLRSSFGVPRDLLKNADMALSGDFTPEQLEALVGNVSEDLIFSVLLALKTNSADFSTKISALLEESSKEQLTQFRDFFTRYILERKGIDGCTISSDKIKALDAAYKEADLLKIGQTLVKATKDTFILELELLNMQLTGTGTRDFVGQQVDKSIIERAGTPTLSKEVLAVKRQEAKISAGSLKNLRLE